MLYKVLGMIVWRIGKRVARRKAGGSPAPLLAGALVAVLVASPCAARRARAATARPART